jgi:hypothetical protein
VCPASPLSLVSQALGTKLSLHSQARLLQRKQLLRTPQGIGQRVDNQGAPTPVWPVANPAAWYQKSQHERCSRPFAQESAGVSNRVVENKCRLLLLLMPHAVVGHSCSQVSLEALHQHTGAGAASRNTAQRRWSSRPCGPHSSQVRRHTATAGSAERRQAAWAIRCRFQQARSKASAP